MLKAGAVGLFQDSVEELIIASSELRGVGPPGTKCSHLRGLSSVKALPPEELSVKRFAYSSG